MTDRHQELMDQAYARWQQHTSWTKEEFDDQLDADERFAVHTGNLNYQVENGGFMQWLDNGYASPQVVTYLERLLKKMQGEAATKVLALLNEFSALAASYSRHPDEEAYEELSEKLNALDSAYYDVSTQFLVECKAAIENKVWRS